MRRPCPLCQQQLAENLLIFWLAVCAEYYQQVGPNTKSDLTAFTVDGFSKGGQCIRVAIYVPDIQVQESCFVQQDGLIGVEWGRSCVTTVDWLIGLTG